LISKEKKHDMYNKFFISNELEDIGWTNEERRRHGIITF